jgi:hypothetical protein
MENPQMGMPAEMAPQGPNPEEMAIYEQMRQQISPQEFSNEMLAGASQVDPQAVAEFTEELRGLDVSPEELDALNDLVDQILANPEQYDQLRQQFLAQGMPDDILPEQFDPYFFAALNMAVDQMIAAPTGVQAFAKGGIAELKPIAKAIASYGRNGDTMLAHITPAEARMLKRRGGSGTINPATGLPEFFLKKAFKKIGKAVKKFASSTVGRLVTTVALGFFLGPAAASFLGASSVAGVAAVSGFVGSAGSTLLAGGNLKDALKAGAIGGLTAGAGAGLMGGADAFASGSASTAGLTPGQAFQGQVDKFTGAFTPGASVQAPVPEAGAPTAGLGSNQMPVPDTAPYSELKMTGTPVKPFPEFFGDQASATAPAADPLGNFIQQNEALRTAANTPVGGQTSLVDQAKDFYTRNTPTAIKEAATPGAQQAGAKAVADYKAQMAASGITPTDAALTNVYNKAFNTAMPGTLATYGPTIAAGTGIMALSGGFKTKPVEGGDITKSLMKPVTQRIAEEGTQRQMYMQGLPGVVYDEFGAPVFGQSTRLPTYDVPDYDAGGFRSFGSSSQPSMTLPPVYIPPPGTIGSRRVEQPYNTSSMYTNLMGPQRYADGGQVQYFDEGGPVALPPPPAAQAAPAKTPEQIAAEKQAALEAMMAQQKAGRDIANQRRAQRRAAGSGAMYANINAGISALAPENFPGGPVALAPEREAAIRGMVGKPGSDIDYARVMQQQGYRPEEVAAVTGRSFGDINRRFNTALRQDAYAPMLEGQRNAMAEQARILGMSGMAPGQMGSMPVASAYPNQSDNAFLPFFPGAGSAMTTPSVVRPPVVPPIVRPPVVQPAYSDQNIRDYLSTRPNMTDAEIRSAMDDFKVTPAQMASATGLPVEQVQQRYDAPSNFSNEAIQSYLAARPGLTDMQIRSAMDEFKVTPAQMASATGLPFEQVQQRYAAAAPRLLNMGGIAALAQGGYPRRTGQISGPGTEKSDSIPAMLSDGEFVLTAKAVRGADPTGKGNRRAGAKQMYKLMHQLEKNSERG